MSGARHWEQDKEATIYVGNLDERVTDEIVWELMLQAGRIVNVHLPKDRVTQTHQGYGFVEFASEEDAEYAAKIMNQVRLWGKPIRVNKASADKQKTVEVGAELFVGNLDPMVDEKVLFETFSRFGNLVAAPKIARDDANLSKGYGFLSFATFESSDDAIANMHGQYLMNKEITVQYAYKKDGKGERHGDPAERALAAQAQKHGVEVPIPALPAALVMGNAPSGPAAMMGNGAPHEAPRGPSMQAPPSYNYGSYNAPGYAQPPPSMQMSGPPTYNPQGYQGYAQPPTPMQMSGPPTYNPQGYSQPPTPVQMNGAPSYPPRQYTQSPLQPPPEAAGLPARPPPSLTGYSPQGMPNGPPQFMPPPGYGPPPGVPGMMPPGFAPPGYGPPMQNGFGPPQNR